MIKTNKDNVVYYCSVPLPTWWERLRGITMEKKLAKYKRKVKNREPVPMIRWER